VWAQQQLLQCEQIEFRSIGDAVKKLKDWGRVRGIKRWLSLSGSLHRRTQLILEQLPALRTSALEFSGHVSVPACAGFALLSANILLVSAKVLPLLVDGVANFAETKAAPSRAYLKLWNLFAHHLPPPQAGEFCIDLGSCPGGWTWVLAGLGAQVLSVDKAPLDPRVRALKNVRYLSKDAFSLTPGQVEQPVDWLFSDIICAPSRILELVEIWRPSGRVKNFVCTVKFKGQTDVDTLNRLLAIPGSQAVHLFHNKHEVTWYLKA